MNGFKRRVDYDQILRGSCERKRSVTYSSPTNGLANVLVAEAEAEQWRRTEKTEKTSRNKKKERKGKKREK